MNSHEGRMFRKFLARNVNLRRVFFMPGGLVTITAVIAAVAEPSFSESLDSSFTVEDSGDAAPFPRFSSSIN
jgi:hypothetical protein